MHHAIAPIEKRAVHTRSPPIVRDHYCYKMKTEFEPTNEPPCHGDATLDADLKRGPVGLAREKEAACESHCHERGYRSSAAIAMITYAGIIVE